MKTSRHLTGHTLRRLASLTLVLTLGCDDTTDETTVIDVPDAEQLVDPDAAPLPFDAAARPDGEIIPVDAAIEPDLATPDMALPVDASPPDASAELAQCANGLDDDQDGLTDYPLDPGCADRADDDEADPEAVACADTIDNDDDGLTDLEDPGCSDAADPSERSICGEQIPFSDITGRTQVQGTTAGASLLNACRNNDAPEAVFVYTVRENIDRLHFDTIGSSFDTLLSARTLCDLPASELICADDLPDGRTQSAFDIEAPAPGDYFIIVDGFLDAQGPFTLNIRAELNDGRACGVEGSVATCGPVSACRDGVCAPAQCADGQDNDADGLIDYPIDPGCVVESDDDETTPDPLPQCADTLDNDNDGLIDFPDDTDCSAAGDDEESRAPQCRDGVDNDRDGLIDLLDPGCQGNPDRTSEFNFEACRDGQDNDEDGHADFPADPGCADPLDGDETDPAELAECSDGIDNDEDGLTDYPEDVASCLFAADDNEDDPCLRREPREITGLRLLLGTTENQGNDFQLSCELGSARDQLLLWRTADDRPLQDLLINTANSDFDTALAHFASCGGEELACDDDSGPIFAASLRTGPIAAGSEALIVLSGARNGEDGIWRAEVTAFLDEGADCSDVAPGSPFVCGDGLNCALQNGEERCTAAACADGVDNDNDGLTDYPNEPGCDSASDDDETDPAERPVCSNGIDDDEDGLTDFGEDPRCDSAADPFEGPDCSDGIDNDGDGGRDYDRNNDGFPDNDRDGDCACATDEEETAQGQCADHCDNDRDGLIDLADPGCMGDPEHFTESNTPACRDGRDNDEDGVTDFPNEPGCVTADDQDETDPEVLPACSDGVDNDEDGATDFGNDPGCQSAGDPDERGLCEAGAYRIPEDGIVRGTTRIEQHEHSSRCRGGSSPEAMYRVDLPYPAQIVASLEGSAFDTVLYARRACEAEQICDAEEPPMGGVGGGGGGLEPDMGVDAGVQDAAVEDAAVQDAGVEDAAVADAAEPDAAVVDAAVVDAAVPDAALPPVPCVPGITEVACNDNFHGLQSEVTVDWQGGPLFLFVEGFSRAAGDYVLTVTGTYAEGAQCGPILHPLVRCTLGTECLPDEAAGFPTCQAN